MSGRKQHYIPQLLLRGFCSREQTKPFHAWVFTKDGKSYESNIDSIGAERDFYVFDEDLNADDHITSLEPEFGKLIAILRSGGIDSVEKSEIVRLIIHIQARARWFRSTFTSSSTMLMNRILEYVRSEAFIDGIINSMLEGENPYLHKGLEKVHQELSMSGISREAFGALVSVFIAKNRDALKSFLLPQINEAIEKIPEAIEPAIQKAHIELQLHDYTESERHRLYQELDYRIIDCSPKRVILGDCTVLSIIDGPARYSALPSKDQTLTAIILPISSTKYIIGSKFDAQIDTDDLNAAIAELSDRFFVSSRNDDYERNLQKGIGLKSFLLSNEEIKLLAEACISANQLARQ